MYQGHSESMTGPSHTASGCTRWEYNAFLIDRGNKKTEFYSQKEINIGFIHVIACVWSFSLFKDK
jgi:hypothetical protein